MRARLARLVSLQSEIQQSSIAPMPTRPLPSSRSEALRSRSSEGGSKDGFGVSPGVLSIQSGGVEPGWVMVVQPVMGTEFPGGIGGNVICAHAMLLDKTAMQTTTT